ncbi:MAG TPA: GAF domain-containing protein [Nitrososphaerales archaeon]|nr:GAF domain-containing protein [Nitrososphaerales archaeon]HUK74704.1 GAF domain-containing protein [Nitrososphaerales archaeon]
MKSQPRMNRERAKELLAEVDLLLSRKDPAPALRKSIVQLLNLEPTYNWVGLYLLKGGELRLDAWSGPAPTTHTSIPLGKGICGLAAKSGRTEIVSDVSKEPRYLQCFANTRSEIVVPIHLDGKVVGEIDIDSDVLNAHSSVDREFLEAVASKISKSCA